MRIYECLRRLLPTVYSSRKRLDRIHVDESNNNLSSAASASDDITAGGFDRYTAMDDQERQLQGVVEPVPTDEAQAAAVTEEEEEEDAVAAASAAQFSGDARHSE